MFSNCNYNYKLSICKTITDPQMLFENSVKDFFQKMAIMTSTQVSGSFKWICTISNQNSITS